MSLEQHKQLLRTFMINAITTQTVEETFPDEIHSNYKHEWFIINKQNQVCFNWRNFIIPFRRASVILQKQGHVGIVKNLDEFLFDSAYESHKFIQSVLNSKAVKEFKQQLLLPQIEQENLQNQLQQIDKEIASLQEKREKIINQLKG